MAEQDDDVSRFRFPQVDVGSFALVIVVFVGVIALRIVAVSDWNFDLAGNLLSGISFTDLPSLIISILFSNRHDMTVLLVAIGAYFYLGSLTSPLKLQRLAVSLAVLIAVLALNERFVVHGRVPGYWVTGFVILGVVIALVASILAYDDGFVVILAVARAAAVVATFVGSVAIATSNAPWVPRECLYTASGGPATGWVVGENLNSQWLRVLTDTMPRSLRLVRISDVSIRVSTPSGQCPAMSAG